MSQVWMDEISLEDVVSMSSHVLLVSKAEPRSRTQHIPIDRPTYDGQPCPRFALFFGRFNVEEVLRGPQALHGTTIEVAPHGWKSDLERHISYYVEGLSESPIVPSYTARDATDGNRLILFCRPGDGGRLEYSVQSAVEGPELLEEVRGLTR